MTSAHNSARIQSRHCDFLCHVVPRPHIDVSAPALGIERARKLLFYLEESANAQKLPMKLPIPMQFLKNVAIVSRVH